MYGEQDRPEANEQIAMQQEVMQNLLMASIKEQRRQRRWGIFFKSLTFIYLFALLITFLPGDGQDAGSLARSKHTALVDVNGVIADNTDANADSIITALRAAFDDKKTAGIILRINSPGGSPVQAGYVYDEIKRLREKYPDTRLYAVVTDVCASGGYYIAAAADEIYADKASMVGSIGVLMNGFGFTKAMEKLGVERRLYTAGESKGFLDPFSPQQPDDVEHVHGLLKNIHDQFIDVVREGRGDRLKNDPRLFTGLIWTGEESVELGLIDGLGSSSYVAREVIQEERIVDFTPKANYLERFAERLGVAMANVMSTTLSGGQTPLR
ncbi:MAG: S49 family peptidase [Gammaproteobacteria bacterium]